MNNKTFERHQKYTLLIISLMAHTMLIILLFSSHLGTELKPLLDENDMPIFDQQRAALIPGASQFGAPVIFQDPSFAKASEDRPSPLEMTQTTPTAEQKSVPEPQQKTSEQTTIDKLLATKMLTARKLAEEKEARILRQAQDERKKKASQKRRVIPPKAPVHPEQEKNLTIADIARGFLDTIDKGGQDMLERSGNASMRPDLEEMKYIRYVEKIGWCIQQAYKVDPSPPALLFDGSVDLLIRMALDKQGHLLELKMLKSTGYADLDAFLLRGIRSASPYPPIPDYFNTDKFTLPAASIRTFGKSQSGFGIRIS